MLKNKPRTHHPSPHLIVATSVRMARVDCARGQDLGACTSLPFVLDGRHGCSPLDPFMDKLDFLCGVGIGMLDLVLNPNIS